MPNHVEHDMWVSGKPEVIEKFLDFAKDDQSILSADKFIPYPKMFKDLDEKANQRFEQLVMLRGLAEKAVGTPAYDAIAKDIAKLETQRDVTDGFNSGGYDWCVRSWGTKWGIYNASIKKRTKRSVKFLFESAWSPPTPVIEKMGELFPHLSFTVRYYECGGAFKGVIKVKNGKTVENSTARYHGHRGG